MSEVSTGAQDEDPMVREVTQWLSNNPATPEPAGDLVERVKDALSEFGDDYMTSNAHHPGYVLIPAEQFDRACIARAAIAAMPDHAALVGEVESLKTQLERERMRLAACGVVAMSDTQESAARNRDMHADYKSASCDEVARRVDECMTLRTQLAAREANVARLREALVAVETEGLRNHNTRCRLWWGLVRAAIKDTQP